MPRRLTPLVPLALLVLPALALGGLGAAVVAAAPGRATSAGAGAPAHFAARQIVGLALAALVGVGVARLGTRRALRAAPILFAGALAITAAVFLPGVGVKAGGASRWLRLGPLSGDPAPVLIAAAGLIIAAWRAGMTEGVLARWWLMLGLTLAALGLLVAEPDFSAAAVLLAVTAGALAGGGVPLRRVLPPAAVMLVLLAVGASRFGYVGGRIHGFLAPEQDRRGKGFEVLQLARANAGVSASGVGLGHGSARRHLHAPASDYVYAVVTEELGWIGALGVAGAWLAIGAGALVAVRAARRDAGARATAVAAATALLAPAALHVAVCRGFIPIIGVSMPFLSYDPALTVVSGAELGLLTAVAMGGPGALDQATPA
jgi:cell division protein FtsW